MVDAVCAVNIGIRVPPGGGIEAEGINEGAKLEFVGACHGQDLSAGAVENSCEGVKRAVSLAGRRDR